MLKILRAGMYTSLQGGKRIGLRQSGVSYSGALDGPALEIANALVGNAAEAAALEITLGQCEVEFARDCWFALTGAGCDAMLDGTDVWTGWRFAAKAGQRLVLNRPRFGVRSYLAVAGGFDLPEVMGSGSTDLKTAIGGLEGRLLRDGDMLPPGTPSRSFSAQQGVKLLLWTNRIRADLKSIRLNSSYITTSHAVLFLNKKYYLHSTVLIPSSVFFLLVLLTLLTLQ